MGDRMKTYQQKMDDLLFNIADRKLKAKKEKKQIKCYHCKKLFTPTFNEAMDDLITEAQKHYCKECIDYLDS